MNQTTGPDMEIVIEPPKGLHPFALKEIWAYRELLTQLVWRDVAVRYKQTALGVLWAVLNPVLTALVFTVIFGIWARLPTGGIPFAAFFLAGITPWTFFAAALSSAANSMVAQRNLLTKVYFPRVIAPLSATATPFVDFLLALAVLLVVAFLYGFIPRMEALIVLPLTVLWVWTAAFGLGLWFAALNVRYRDVGQLVPFIVRVGMFASPVIYPVSMIPEKWHWLYGLNPVVGAIEWTRWCLFDTGSPPDNVFFASILIAMLLLLSGAYMFRRMENTFADVV